MDLIQYLILPIMAGYFPAVYDSTSGKIVIFYGNSRNTTGNVIAGTVSGNSISFGSPFEVESDSTKLPFSSI